MTPVSQTTISLRAESLAFAREGYVRLPRSAFATVFPKLQREVARLREHAKTRDFIMPGYETLRRMSTLGGKDIRRLSPVLVDFYQNPAIRALLSNICGQEVFACHDENEWQVINWLEGPGETHGWHLDDPPLALVLFIETPPASDGGALELIYGWRQLCAVVGSEPEHSATSLIERCRAAGLVTAKVHTTGDAYLMRADQCLHRAAPLTAAGARRCVVNLAFELEPEVRRTGVTASLLYDQTKND
jgi:hypothetical protein